MSEPYQIACMILETLAAERGVLITHELLRQADILIADDSLLALHDTDTDEPWPEPVLDEAAALRSLIAWPTMGALDYASAEGMVSVEYHRTPGSDTLACVIISAMERAVERAGMLPHYQHLAARLHSGLNARRTILEWGLEMRGFRYEDELARLAEGEFSGTYPLLDLRTP